MQFILQAFNTVSCQDILELRLDPRRSGKAVRRGCVSEKIHTHLPFPVLAVSQLSCFQACQCSSVEHRWWSCIQMGSV